MQRRRDRAKTSYVDTVRYSRSWRSMGPWRKARLVVLLGGAALVLVGLAVGLPWPMVATGWALIIVLGLFDMLPNPRDWASMAKRWWHNP